MYTHMISKTQLYLPLQELTDSKIDFSLLGSIVASSINKFMEHVKGNTSSKSMSQLPGVEVAEKVLGARTPHHPGSFADSVNGMGC